MVGKGVRVCGTKDGNAVGSIVLLEPPAETVGGAGVDETADAE